MTTEELFAKLPPLPEEELTGKVAEALESSGKTILVLDDDPTGTQTVFDVPVLTDLSAKSVREAIEEEPPVLFLLTNSRALTAEQTRKLHSDLGKVLKEFREDLVLISRSDSTLRGHYPLEIDVLQEALGIPDAPTLLIPFFEAGGRLTIDNIHYVVEGDLATPAHQTPFAQDNAFPFSHSHLPDYVEEKTAGRITADTVQTLSLEEMRSGDLAKRLADLPNGSTCVVNATSLKDLNRLSLAIHQSERTFLFRTAASFVQSLAGIPPRPVLEPWQLMDLEPNKNGGLIIVGSHVPKTSSQLSHLIENGKDLVSFQLDIPKLLQEPDETLFPLSADINKAIETGNSVVLFTSRERIDAPNEAANLALSQTISRSLVSLVQSLASRPRFLIAKGGITSSDIATDALGVRKAIVLGQILPGVPVWTLGSETRFPGLAYIIFPGNVGGPDALTEAYQKLP